MRKTTKKEHYVNNKEFLQAMIEYRKMVNKAKRNKQPGMRGMPHDCLR